ncbi:SURF1 family protein [Rhizobium rosettiformans]|uniref:SURF1-like protein n=1 Tax=Rhizobium rosettiformans TaxID=1368430 RepID=A0ABX7EV80_9HYPH|nr:SURF1 family protein [Rhizobium rosettiformans]QRF52168.1 SURF1 family protein [Rhizobium rosettiformans]
MNEADREGRRTWRFWAALVLVPVALVILLSLGTWQVNRLHWKESLLADIQERSNAAPVDIAGLERLMAEGGAIDYRHATVSGRYLHDKERHFLATFGGQSGFYLYTPLELADGRYLLVNRGFVPYDRKDPASRTEGQIEGVQTVTGLARAELTEKPSSLVPDNDEQANIFYWKDLGRMAASVDLPADRVLPFFLDADSTPIAGGLPRGGVTQIDLPNNHMQYVITWYGLAVALVAVAVAGLFRRKTR